MFVMPVIDSCMVFGSFIRPACLGMKTTCELMILYFHIKYCTLISPNEINIDFTQTLTNILYFLFRTGRVIVPLILFLMKLCPLSCNVLLSVVEYDVKMK
ncbi:hypothetical protein ACF0H5_015023 [Mactra antiquata]